MKWLSTLFLSKEQKVFLDVAKKVFADVCESDVSAARIYRDHPEVKKQDWDSINKTLLELIRTGDITERTKKIRGKFAEMIELLVTDHFYTNLEAEDRECYANYIGSTMEVEDRNYYFSLAYHYSYATILEVIIFGGWDGSQASARQLKQLQENYTDSCQDTCKLGLSIAQAKKQGREITDKEKESWKTTMMLKELGRRGLAGEKVFDE